MCLALAYMIGGAVDIALFIWQSFIAINILEITNYIEHYALTRKYLEMDVMSRLNRTILGIRD